MIKHVLEILEFVKLIQIEGGAVVSTRFSRERSGSISNCRICRRMVLNHFSKERSGSQRYGLLLKVTFQSDNARV